jgi:hypothetical protein
VIDQIDDETLGRLRGAVAVARTRAWKLGAGQRVELGRRAASTCHGIARVGVAEAEVDDAAVQSSAR